MLEEVLLEVKDNGSLIDRGCDQERPILPWQGESTVTVRMVCNGFFVESETENRRSDNG